MKKGTAGWWNYASGVAMALAFSAPDIGHLGQWGVWIWRGLLMGVSAVTFWLGRRAK